MLASQNSESAPPIDPDTGLSLSKDDLTLKLLHDLKGSVDRLHEGNSRPLAETKPSQYRMIVVPNHDQDLVHDYEAASLQSSNGFEHQVSDVSDISVHSVEATLPPYVVNGLSKGGVDLPWNNGTATEAPSPQYPVQDIHKEVDHLINKSVETGLPASPATRLRRQLEETSDLIVCPGVYDGFSARIAIAVGFDALYMTGAGTTASRLGMADLGLAQLHDMREHAEMIANLDPQGPPLIADMDTGYGGPIMIANAVQQYIRGGVAGFHIEDQIQNKRCGHLQGKRVVDKETFLQRIRAAKAAKDRCRSDIVLIARTDANQQHGYDECISRLKAAREIGADVGLLEGFTSKEQARQAVLDLAPWPLLLNSVENGSSPLITVKEAQDMGFRIMIFSFAALAPAYGAIKSAFELLKSEGIVGTRKDLTPRMLFEVCGLQNSMEVDAAAGGLDFAGGV